MEISFNKSNLTLNKGGSYPGGACFGVGLGGELFVTYLGLPFGALFKYGAF